MINLTTNIDTGPLLVFSAAAAGTVHSADQINQCGKGIKLVLDITVATTTTVTITLEGKDSGSGKYYTILASAAKTSTGTTVLTVFPGAPVTSNVSANDILPRIWRVTAVVADNSGTSALTGTIGASVIE